MPNTTQIPTARSTDLVTFTIKIDGEKIPDTIGILTVAVHREANRIPTAKIVILDGDPAQQNFNVSSDSLFIPGKDIEILAGYHSDETSIFKGLIIKHSLKIREDGSSVLLLDCKDTAVKMTIGRKNKYYYESKDSEVIEEIIGTYSGLNANISDTIVTHSELVQYRSSDWDFIQNRAEVNAKICLIEDGEIIISEPDIAQDAVVTVSYGDTILAFDAEIDARLQYQSVVSKAWDFAGQEVVETEATEPGISGGGNLSAEELANVIGQENFEIQHGGRANETELQAWADAQLLRVRLAKVRGRVKFQGIPEVKPGKVIELQGVGDRFNGKVFVSAVRHLISEGTWVSDVQFGLNPEWFSETYDLSQIPASGLFPAISGLQIALVTQLADDPDGENRILIRLPIIDAAEQGIWARVASLDAGENRGAYFRPEVGDEVIVGFINDDPGEAVVLGMLHSSAKPAPLEASDDNHEKGFVTRSEMKLLFNDEEKSVRIETPEGNIISLSEDEGAISIEDQNSNKILLDADGITIESAADLTIKASGDINIEGTNVNAKANAQFKAEGSAGAELSSGATAVLKGSLVQIN